MNTLSFGKLVAAWAAFTATAAWAAPVAYTFSTGAGPSGASDIAALLGTDASVTGTFTYNNAGSFLGGSGALGFEPGYALYIGDTVETASFGKLVGQVAGLSFSDVVGTVAVGNNLAAAGGADVLSLVVDPAIAAGRQTPPADRPRQLAGFAVGDYTLHNVRLYWTGLPTFLPSYALPSQPPAFPGTLALDFVLTNDPANTAGVPYYSRTVFFQGLMVQAAAVPEPATLCLSLSGLALAGVAARRRANSLR